jgi:long-subunit acyl-CoA synthetase (AMP-forming)
LPSSSRSADALLFRALRDRLGFSRITSVATGGAALGPDTFRFFLALGVPLRQLYGQTELLGAYTLHREGEVDFNSVGVPLNAEIQVRIDRPDANGLGEIVTRHPTIFFGYFRAGDAAGERRDGWLHTGDAGYFDAKGHLVMIDRIKDIATTARGDRFSPQFIENELKLSPYVAEAVILADRRDFIAAMVCIRYPVVATWAERAHRLHHLQRPRCQAGGGSADPRRGGQGVRLPPRGAAHPQVPAPPQGARCRRRGADAHPQAAPRRHRRQVSRHHRRDPQRQDLDPGRYRDQIPGRHDAADPH